MGFLDGVLKGAMSIASDMAEHGREVARLRSEYESYSDDRLVKIYRDNGVFGSKDTERHAAFAVLKDRYGAEGAKDKICRRF